MKLSRGLAKQNSIMLCNMCLRKCQSLGVFVGVCEIMLKLMTIRIQVRNPIDIVYNTATVVEIKWVN